MKKTSIPRQTIRLVKTVCLLLLWAMAVQGMIARRLARTRFGRWALSRETDLSIFKAKPTPRFYAGLVLVALSYLLGLPAVAICAYLAHQWEKPLVLLLGGGAIWVLVHLMFTAGAYLCGGNYALALLRWVTNRFLNKNLSLS